VPGSSDTPPSGHTSRIVRLLRAAAVVLVLSSTSVSAQPDACGDVNGDGNLSTVDALIVLRSTIGVDVDLGCPEVTGLDPDGCGDVNGDGIVSPLDSLILLNHAVGVTVDFDCALGTDARNLVRFTNTIVCMGAPFKATVEVLPSGKTWSARTGETSEYVEWDQYLIGDTFVVDMRACGERVLNGRVDLAKGHLVHMYLKRSEVFNTVQLSIVEEGPIAGLVGQPKVLR
jgi:hypothetical protein